MEMQSENIKANFKRENRVDFSPVDIGRRTEIYRNIPPANEKSENETIQAQKDKTIVIKALDKILGFGLFMIFLGIPLFFTGLTFQGIIFEKELYFYFWLLLCLVSWTAKGVILGEMNIRRTALDIPMIGFWLVYLLATLFSVDRWHSFWGMLGDPSRGFMNVTALIVAYYLILSNFNLKRLQLMFIALISSGIFVSIWTFLAIRNVQFLPLKMTLYSPLSLVGSISGLGIFFSFMLPIMTTAIFKLAENQTLKPIFKKILISVLVLALLLDLVLLLSLYNFVPLIGMLIGSGVFLLFILSGIVRPKMSWIWLPMVIFVIVTAMAFHMVGEIGISKVNLPAEVSPNYQTSWNIAISSLKNKFILGSGPATYGYNFSMNRPQEFNLNALYTLRFSQGTGIIFEALPTIGLIGTFFLVLGILSLLSLEIYFLCRGKENNKIYSLGFFAALVILLIDIISIRTEGTILIITVLVGIISLSTVLFESKLQEKYLGLSLKASPKFALALAFVFMVVSAGVAFLFVFLGKVYVADVYAGIADRQVYVNQEDSIIKMSKAINLNNRESKYYAQLGQYYMLLANKEAMKGDTERDLQKIQQYLNFSIAATRQGQDLGKNDINSVEILAQIYENAGLYVIDSLNLAQESYKRGLELEPHNPNYYVKLGQIELSLATTKKDEQEKKQLISEARNLFQKSVEEKNNFDVGYYQLALTENFLGEIDKSIENATKAIQINPQNNDYILGLARMYQNRGKEDDLKASEQLYKAMIQRDDKNINAHFYLGLLYEKLQNKQGAKDEYNRVMGLLPDNSEDTRKQLQKMISNLERGIENTPETLGLTGSEENHENTNSGSEENTNTQP
jgi:cytochrome c-type biogenesis protein CcmH/NrfG